MSIKIIRERHTEDIVEYTYYYCFDLSNPYTGYGFPCDKKGQIDVASLTPEAKTNLALCLEGKDEEGKTIYPVGVHKYHRSYPVPAVGLCTCGREVFLGGFTNTCDCGRDYNSSGCLLADRSQWGEETGEHPADIARIK